MPQKETQESLQHHKEKERMIWACLCPFRLPKPFHGLIPNENAQATTETSSEGSKLHNMPWYVNFSNRDLHKEPPSSHCCNANLTWLKCSGCFAGHESVPIWKQNCSHVNLETWGESRTHTKARADGTLPSCELMNKSGLSSITKAVLDALHWTRTMKGFTLMLRFRPWAVDVKQSEKLTWKWLSSLKKTKTDCKLQTRSCGCFPRR